MAAMMIFLTARAEIEVQDEYGIVLLPDPKGRLEIEEISKKIKIGFDDQDISYNKEMNHPHISLFQSVFTEEGVNKLKNVLAKMAASHDKITVLVVKNLEDTKENIFLNVENTPEIIKIRDMVFDHKLHELRDCSRVMKQVQRDQKDGVNEDQQKKINEFGVYWNLRGSKALHFTIVYESNMNSKIEPLLDKTIINIDEINLPHLALVKLGFNGNVVEIIDKYKLG